MARMQDANMAALSQPAARRIAEYHLDRYFEMVEAEVGCGELMVLEAPGLPPARRLAPSLSPLHKD
jgi:hypothetical protein